jgi:hypothetical protein
MIEKSNHAPPENRKIHQRPEASRIASPARPRSGVDAAPRSLMPTLLFAGGAADPASSADERRSPRTGERRLFEQGGAA